MRRRKAEFLQNVTRSKLEGGCGKQKSSTVARAAPQASKVELELHHNRHSQAGVIFAQVGTPTGGTGYTSGPGGGG